MWRRSAGARGEKRWSPIRISTGNCTVGTGFAYWDPDIAISGLTSVPRSTWIDFVVHLVFSESDGTVEVWHRTGSGSFPATPQLARYGIPTLPYADSARIHGVSLYTEMGLYAGRAGYGGSDTVYLDGYRRGTSMAAVLAEFPGGVPTPTAPPGIAAVSLPSSPSHDAQSAAGRAAAAATTPATVPPPTIVQSIRGGQTLRGTVTWTAVPSSPVKQVVFAMDDNETAVTDGSAPYAYSLETARFANGVHTLGLTVTLLDGTVVWRPYQLGIITIENRAPEEVTVSDPAGPKTIRPPLAAARATERRASASRRTARRAS